MCSSLSSSMYFSARCLTSCLRSCRLSRLGGHYAKQLVARPLSLFRRAHNTLYVVDTVAGVSQRSRPGDMLNIMHVIVALCHKPRRYEPVRKVSMLPSC